MGLEIRRLQEVIKELHNEAAKTAGQNGEMIASLNEEIEELKGQI